MTTSEYARHHAYLFQGKNKEHNDCCCAV